jgi:hypothetical protein
VFWNASSGTTIETQILSAWYSLDKCIDWSFEQVKTLFSNAPEFIIRLLQMKYDCSPDEASELQELMQIWVSDVKQQFA